MSTGHSSTSALISASSASSPVPGVRGSRPSADGAMPREKPTWAGTMPSSTALLLNTRRCGRLRRAAPGEGRRNALAARFIAPTTTAVTTGASNAAGPESPREHAREEGRVGTSTHSTRLFTSQRAARVHRADEGALSESRVTRHLSNPSAREMQLSLISARVFVSQFVLPRAHYCQLIPKLPTTNSLPTC